MRFVINPIALRKAKTVYISVSLYAIGLNKIFIMIMYNHRSLLSVFILQMSVFTDSYLKKHLPL